MQPDATRCKLGVTCSGEPVEPSAGPFGTSWLSCNLVATFLHFKPNVLLDVEQFERLHSPNISTNCLQKRFGSEQEQP